LSVFAGFLTNRCANLWFRNINMRGIVRYFCQLLQTNRVVRRISFKAIMPTVLLTILLTVLALNPLPAQNDSQHYNARKRHAWNFRKGIKLFQEQRYEDAFSVFSWLLSYQPDHSNIAFYAGLSKMNSSGGTTASIPFFERASKRVVNKHKAKFSRNEAPPHTFLYLGNALLQAARYSEAIDAFERFKIYIPDAMVGLKDEVNNQIAICTDALYREGRLTRKDSLLLIADFFRKRMIQLDFSEVNTRYADMGATILRNGNIFFSSNRPDTSNKDNSYMPVGVLTSNIYMMDHDGGKWGPPVLFRTFSSIANEKFCSVNEAETHAVLVSDMRGRYDIYESFKIDGNWSKPKKININSSKDEAYACLTPEGDAMYFSSSRKGGYGGLDLYFSPKIKDGKWGKPVNLGPFINSSGDEDAPFITESGELLYFSSTGHRSTGGYDIFFSRLEADSTWGLPTNLGPAVNSTADDLYYKVFGQKVFFSSNRRGGKGDFDMYMAENIDVPFVDEPDSNLMVVKGRIIYEDEKPVKGLITFVDKKTAEPIAETKTFSNGLYAIMLPKNREIEMVLNTDEKQYLAESYQPVPETEHEGNLMVLEEPLFTIVSPDMLEKHYAEIKKASEYIILSGSIINEQMEPVKVFIEFFDLKTKELIAAIPTNDAGEYELTLPAGSEKYGVKIHAEDYLFWSENFDIQDAVKQGKNLVTVLNNRDFEVTPISLASKETKINDTETFELPLDNKQIKEDIIAEKNPVENQTPIKEDTEVVAEKTTIKEQVKVQEKTEKETTVVPEKKEFGPIAKGQVVVIQVGAVRVVPEQYYASLSTVWRYKAKDGLTKYFVGEYAGKQEAMADLIKIRELGFEDAFLSVINKAEVNIEKLVLTPSPYTVQLGAGKMQHNYFLKIDNVEACEGSDNLRRFISGEFNKLSEAQQVRKKAVELGYKDAWIPVIDNNRRQCMPIHATAAQGTNNQ